MKPKKTFLEKKETARRKNRAHLSMHRYEISARRSGRKVLNELQQSAILTRELQQLQVDNVDDDLMMNREEEQSDTGLFDESHMNIHCLDEDQTGAGVLDSISNDRSDQNDCRATESSEAENVEDNCVEQDDFDDNYLEEFITVVSDREYDELVSGKQIDYLLDFLFSSRTLLLY